MPQQESRDRTFIVTLQVEGHGRSEQLLKEYSECLDRMLYQEFGELAELESIIELHETDLTDAQP